MGAFPFLNNQIIAEGAKPPEIPNPMVSMQQALEVQKLRQENSTFPLKQQDLQSQVNERTANAQRVGIANEKARRDEEDEKAHQQALIDSGGDPDKLESAALKVTNPNLQSKLLDTASKLRARNEGITAKQHKIYADMTAEYANDLQAVSDAKGNPPLQLGLWASLVKKASAAKDESGNPLVPPGSLDPTTVPPDSVIKTLQTVVDKSGEWHTKAAKLQDEADKATKAKQAEKVKETSDLHAEADTTFQGVTKENMPAAIADFASQDAAHAAYAARWLQPIANSDNAGDIIHKRALTAVQRDTTATTQQERDRQDTRDEEIARHNRAQEVIETQKAARERGETANSRSVDRRQNQRDFDKAQEDEEHLATLRANLENAIKSGGKTYVDEKGNTKAMKKATDDEKDTPDNLTQRMRTAYQDATNKLKRVVADKNTFGEALGKNFTVQTPTIHAALDADMQRVIPDMVKNPVAQPTVPATQQTTPAPAKVSGPMTDIQIPDGKGGWKDMSVPSVSLKAAISRGARLPQ